MTLSSVALIAARVAASGFGFLAWLLAARLFAPAEVGLAAGAVAAMMLAVQIALGGSGSAVIALFPGRRSAPSRLFDTAVIVVTVAALVVAIVFLVLAATRLDELRAIPADAGLAVAFVVMTLFGTLNTLYDYVSVAMRRGDHVLVRNVAFGVMTLVVLALGAASALDGPFAILLAWAVAGSAACAIAWAQLRHAVGYVFAARLDPGLTRSVVSTGVPNWLLSLTERLPALIMPVLVTELISPEANAFWYAAWMMAWVVLIIPTSVGQSLFAEAVHRPTEIREVVRHGTRTALLLGISAAGGMLLLAELALGLLGAQYSAEGALPLRILVLSVVPFTIVQAYYAVSRALGRLPEAIITGAIGGAVAVAAAVSAGIGGGLVAMAAAWLAFQCALGVWAAWRLSRISAAVSDT
ncbi:MAG: hypothetical protein K5924_06385 [Chloroflexi bacterium]|nr:hypothetical protein [Chloroflexota bacterium]